jgi:hypothetical protein
MARAAESLKLDATVLYARLAEIAAVVAPVGLANSPRPGRLLRGLNDLKAFKQSIEDWSNEVRSDAAPVAAFCAEVAQHTIGIGEAVLADFHRRVDAIGPLLCDWDKGIARIRGHATRMAWLLDGWTHLTAAWEVALGEDRHQQAVTVNDLFRIIPLLPKRESSRDLPRIPGTSTRSIAGR